MVNLFITHAFHLFNFFHDVFMFILFSFSIIIMTHNMYKYACMHVCICVRASGARAAARMLKPYTLYAVAPARAGRTGPSGADFD